MNKNEAIESIADIRGEYLKIHPSHIGNEDLRDWLAGLTELIDFILKEDKQPLKPESQAFVYYCEGCEDYKNNHNEIFENQPLCSCGKRLILANNHQKEEVDIKCDKFIPQSIFGEESEFCECSYHKDKHNTDQKEEAEK